MSNFKINLSDTIYNSGTKNKKKTGARKGNQEIDCWTLAKLKLRECTGGGGKKRRKKKKKGEKEERKGKENGKKKMF